MRRDFPPFGNGVDAPTWLVLEVITLKLWPGVLNKTSSVLFLWETIIDVVVVAFLSDEDVAFELQAG